MKRVKNFISNFLAHPSIRKWVGITRYHLLKRTHGVRTLDSIHGRVNTLSHNLTAFEHIDIDFSMPRMIRLLKAVTAIETLNRGSRILVIGPRTESDLLILRGWGFSNSIGLDIISYSPLIVLGDMHNIPFEDSSFDAVVCGWTLSYSTNPSLAIQEMIRVGKPNSILAFGIEHMKASPRKDIARDSRLIIPEKLEDRINCCDQLIAILGIHVGAVYFRHDAPLKDLSADELEYRTELAGSQVMLVAEVLK